MELLKKNVSSILPILFLFLIVAAQVPRGASQPENSTATTQCYVSADTPGNHIDFHFLSYAIVSHITHDFITLIDFSDNKIVDTLQAGEGTDCVAQPNGTDDIYVANYMSNDVTILNGKGGSKIGRIPVGQHPVCVRFTPDGKTALVSHQSTDGLWFIDTKTRVVTAKISEGTGMVYYLKERDMFYQPAIFRPFIHIIDPVKQKIVKSVWVGGRPMSLAFTPDGKYAYIPNYDLKEVQIFDTRLDSVVKVISDIPDPRGITITPDGKYALVTNVTSNTLTVIGLDSNAVVKVIPVDKMPTDVAVTPNGDFAYVTNQGSGSLSIVSLAKLEVVGHVEVADNPISIFMF